jgi:hypothetical protein
MGTTAVVTTHTHEHTDIPETTPWRSILVLAVGLSVGLAVLLAAFAWPATQTRPRDVPIAVVGAPPAVQGVRGALEDAQPGAFDIEAVASEAVARDLVLQREVDGALILAPQGVSAIVATQAGPAVAQALQQVAQKLSGAPPVRVEDVAPAPADDPRGAGLAAGALPLALIGAAAGALLALVVRGAARRAVGALVFALLAGPTAVAVLHGWLGALSGDWLSETAIVSLGLAAIALGVVGVASVAGRGGLALAELAVIAFGNPLSAASSAPAMLPDGWGDLGQFLPPGAIVSALRAVSGFGGTGAGAPMVVLAAWACGGLVLLGIHALRRRRPRDAC